MTTKLYKYTSHNLLENWVLKTAKYCFYQCATHPKNTTLFSNIKALFLSANYTTHHQTLHFGIIHAFRHHYRKQLISKTAATTDEGLLQDAAQMKLDVLSAVHLMAELWRLISPTEIQNCFVKCGFSIDHVSRNETAVKLTEDKENDWHSLQHLSVQSEDCSTCASALKVCGVQSDDQVLEQHLIKPEEPEEESEVAEHKATFLDTLKGLEAARKYVCQFDTTNNSTVMCNKVENELSRIRAQGEKKQKTEWLKK
jgi:hypothetical protein